MNDQQVVAVAERLRAELEVEGRTGFVRDVILGLVFFAAGVGVTLLSLSWSAVHCSSGRPPERRPRTAAPAPQRRPNGRAVAAGMPQLDILIGRFGCDANPSRPVHRRQLVHGLSMKFSR